MKGKNRSRKFAPYEIDPSLFISGSTYIYNHHQRTMGNGNFNGLIQRIFLITQYLNTYMASRLMVIMYDRKPRTIKE